MNTPCHRHASHNAARCAPPPPHAQNDSAADIPPTNQAIRQIRREINDGRLRQEELQKTLLNTENKLEELMDGGRIARMATPLGLRHPPHDQRVIPMKVCRTKEGKVYPVMVGSRR